MPFLKNSLNLLTLTGPIFPSLIELHSGCRQKSAFEKSSHLEQFGSVSRVASVFGSVPVLVLVVPPVEVVVEEHDASRRHAGYDAPLVMGHGHRADSCVTARVREQLFEAVDLPDREYTSISTCQHVLTVTTQKHRLDAVFHLHMPKQFSIDAEKTKLSLVVVDHTVSLSGALDEARPQALLWGLQGPQQVPIHGMDQTRSLFAATDDKPQLRTHTCTRHLTVVAC